MLGEPNIAMGFVCMTNGLKKLNNHNYIDSKGCIEPIYKDMAYMMLQAGQTCFHWMLLKK